MDISFSDFLTPAGLTIAAGIITGLFDLVKAVFPPVSARVSGALMAFVGSAILYAATAVAVPQNTADGYLGVFVAWLGCATAAVGVKALADHVNEVQRGTAGQ